MLKRLDVYENLPVQRGKQKEIAGNGLWTAEQQAPKVSFKKRHVF